MAPLEPRASSASFGASGVAGDDSDQRRRPLPWRPELGRARVRRYLARRDQLRASTGYWGREEHSEATSAGGGAREHGAHRPWRTAASGARGAAATGCAREREVRGNDGKLTGMQQGGSVGSETHRSRRI